MVYGSIFLLNSPKTILLPLICLRKIWQS